MTGKTGPQGGGKGVAVTFNKLTYTVPIKKDTPGPLGGGEWLAFGVAIELDRWAHPKQIELCPNTPPPVMKFHLSNLYRHI